MEYEADEFGLITLADSDLSQGAVNLNGSFMFAISSANKNAQTELAANGLATNGLATNGLATNELEQATIHLDAQLSDESPNGRKSITANGQTNIQHELTFDKSLPETHVVGQSRHLSPTGFPKNPIGPNVDGGDTSPVLPAAITHISATNQATSTLATQHQPQGLNHNLVSSSQKFFAAHRSVNATPVDVVQAASESSDGPGQLVSQLDLQSENVAESSQVSNSFSEIAYSYQPGTRSRNLSNGTTSSDPIIGSNDASADSIFPAVNSQAVSLAADQHASTQTQIDSQIQRLLFRLAFNKVVHALWTTELRLIRTVMKPSRKNQAEITTQSPLATAVANNASQTAQSTRNVVQSKLHSQEPALTTTRIEPKTTVTENSSSSLTSATISRRRH